MNQTKRATDRTDVLTLDGDLDALRWDPELRGPVDSLDGHDSGDHLALIYETQAEQFGAVAPFLRQGLERDERCLYIAAENPKDDILDALAAAGIDTDAALNSGALTILDKQESHSDGKFDPDEMISFLETVVDEATTADKALRVTGEMTWLFGDNPDPDTKELIEYEETLDELFDDETCTTLCQYSRKRFPPAVIRDIIRTHPQLIYDGTVCQNFYYTPPSEMFGPEQPSQAIDRMLRTLQERTEDRMSLHEQEQFLRTLYETAANTDLSFEEKLSAMFELGCEAFDLELGGMARINPKRDTLEIEYVSDDGRGFKPGDTLSVSNTYCGMVVEAGDIVSLAGPLPEDVDVTLDNEKSGVTAYLGTYIPVDGGADRTFFFIASGECMQDFSDTERTFHRLMGQWVKYELDRQQREQYLRASYEVTSSAGLSFEEKLDQLLRIGCQRLDADFGGMACVDPDTDGFEVEFVTDSCDHLQPGDKLPLSQMFCQETAETQGTVAVSDPVEAGYEDAIVHTEFGLEAYVGSYVEVDGGRNRTLFFVSSDPDRRSFSDEECTFVELMGQWVSYELERHRHEHRLSALNELSRELMEAETATDASESVVDAAAAFDFPVMAIALYDEQTGTLCPAAATDAGTCLFDGTSILDIGEGVAWNAFIDGTCKHETDPFSHADDECQCHRSISELLVCPLGTHGVLLTGTTTDEGFSDADPDFVETVAASVAAALERSDREAQLQAREETLAKKTETLEQLDRINTTIRGIHRALVSASTRSEIESVVCRNLADDGGGPFEFAWIGSYSQASETITPREWAGAQNGYLDAVPATDGLVGYGPAGRAVQLREPIVANNILKASEFAQWRETALNRGFTATVALPLVYEGTLYGVLSVYAGQPGAFDDLTQSVLAELSETIAHAINAIESKKALVSNELIELEFTVADPSLEVLELSRELDCTLTLESLVPRTDGGLRAFIATRGVPATAVLEFSSRLAVTDLIHIAEYEKEGEQVCLFQAELTDGSLSETILDHGGLLDYLRIDGDTATARVHLAADAAVREFVEMIKQQYPKTELVAQRTIERNQLTPTEHRATVLEALTDRQREILQTAYLSGYFETPRSRTGTEIAETLGISQPTFNTHIRAAQRKLCRTLFDELQVDR